MHSLEYVLKVPRLFTHNTQDLRNWLNAYFDKERRFEGPYNAWEIVSISGTPEKGTEHFCYYDVKINWFRLELD